MCRSVSLECSVSLYSFNYVVDSVFLFAITLWLGESSDSALLVHVGSLSGMCVKSVA